MCSIIIISLADFQNVVLAGQGKRADRGEILCIAKIAAKSFLTMRGSVTDVMCQFVKKRIKWSLLRN